jgi:hypothetical protein
MDNLLLGKLILPFAGEAHLPVLLSSAAALPPPWKTFRSKSITIPELAEK